jgi:RAT1-interacting protein
LSLYSNSLERIPESRNPLYVNFKITHDQRLIINQEIAFFSYDSEHKLKPLDNESLRYYYPPFFNVPGHQENRFPVELSKGYDSFRQRDDSGDEHLDGLLDTLVEVEKRNGKKTEVDLVTWRGMMTRVCLS